MINKACLMVLKKKLGGLVSGDKVMTEKNMTAKSTLLI